MICRKYLLLISVIGIGFSSFGLLSGGSIGLTEEMNPELWLPFIEATSSATKDERMEVSTCAEEVEAASFAATAAAAFLCSSSALVNKFMEDVTGCWLCDGCMGGVGGEVSTCGVIIMAVMFTEGKGAVVVVCKDVSFCLMLMACSASV